MFATRTFYGPPDLPRTLSTKMQWLPLNGGQGANLTVADMCPQIRTRKSDDVIVKIEVAFGSGQSWNLRGLVAPDFYALFKREDSAIDVGGFSLVNRQDDDHPSRVAITVEQIEEKPPSPR